MYNLFKNLIYNLNCKLNNFLIIFIIEIWCSYTSISMVVFIIQVLIIRIYPKFQYEFLEYLLHYYTLLKLKL